MNEKRKVLSVLFMLCFALFVAFSSSPKQAYAEELTPKEIFTKMNNKMKKVDNYHQSISFDLKLSKKDNKNDTLKMNLSADIEAFDETKFKMDFKLKMPFETPNLSMQMYYAPKGKKTYMYMGMDNYWVKQEIKKKDLELYNIKDSLALSSIMKDVSNVEKVSDNTTIDGKEVIVLKTKISKESIQTLLDEIEFFELLFDAEFDPSSIEDKLQGMTVQYYIDKNTMYPIKITMNMKGYLESILDVLYSELGEEESVEVNKANAEITYSKLNKVKDFEIPKEALNAEEVK